MRLPDFHANWPAIVRRLLPCALLWLGIGNAQAGRPMVTDDARLADPDTCQVESWVKRNRASTETWAVPACNLLGNLEVSAGGALTRMDGVAHVTDVTAQAKTLLRPTDTNGWGVGLAAGTVQHPRDGTRDWYANIPASLSLRDDALMLHANAGWLHAGDGARHRLTWGLGSETQLAAHTWLIAETFGQGQPSHQLGLRHWLVAERIQLDATYGNRNRGGRDARWVSMGVRLLAGR